MMKDYKKKRNFFYVISAFTLFWILLYPIGWLITAIFGTGIIISIDVFCLPFFALIHTIIYLCCYRKEMSPWTIVFVTAMWLSMYIGMFAVLGDKNGLWHLSYETLYGKFGITNIMRCIAFPSAALTFISLIVDMIKYPKAPTE